MPDDQKPPNAIEDLRKGLGLLFRAAKTTLEKLPTGEIESAVISGAKEVGRAVENVTRSVEEQFLKRPGGPAGGVRVATQPTAEGEKTDKKDEAGGAEGNGGDEGKPDGG
jgi:hypothetical protein